MDRADVRHLMMDPSDLRPLAVFRTALHSSGAESTSGRAEGSFFEHALGRDRAELVGRALEAQTEAFGPLQVPVVSEELHRHPNGDALDIGTGEGSFLVKLARENPDVSFLGIDQDEALLAEAESRIREAGLSNVRLEHAFFGPQYRGTHDLIITRFTLQHSSDPHEFLRSAYRSLKPGGTFICIDPVYDYYDSDPPETTWREFRERMLETYRRWRSNPNAPKRACRWLSDAGFEAVRASIGLYSPVTIGHPRFEAAVLITVAALRFDYPDVWDEPYLRELEDWLKHPSSDPYISIAQIAASKGSG